MSAEEYVYERLAKLLGADRRGEFKGVTFGDMSGILQAIAKDIVKEVQS